MAELSWRTFIWAVILGMGFRLGWGLVVMVAKFILGAVASDASF